MATSPVTAWDVNGNPVARSSSSTPTNFPAGFVPDFPAGFVPDSPQTQQFPAGFVPDAQQPTAWDASGNPVPHAGTQLPQQGSLGSRIWQGVRQSALGQIWDTAIAPPQNSTEAHVAMIGGPQTLTVYRAAKNLVTSAENVVKQTGDKYTQAIQDFARTAQDYHNKDYRNLASDVGSVSSDVMGMEPGMDIPAQRARELSEGARPGGNLATPVAKDVIDVGMAAIGSKTLGPEEAEGEEAQAAAKPNIVQKITKGENVTRAPAQRAFRSAANQAATDTGATAAGTSQPVRTLLDEPIGAVGKTEGAAYDLIKKAAGTDLKSLYDYRADLQDAIEDPTNIANRQKLTEELNQTETQIQGGEAKAVANGVSPDVLDQAKRMTQQRYALQDVKKQLFNNESVISGNARYGADEQINVNAAIKNLEKLDKPSKFAPEGSPSRLRQALGDKAADQLFRNLYDAQRAGQEAIRARKVAAWVAAGVPIVGGTVEFVKKATGN
ncbi:MAG TPA: hypothetical protein VGR97_08205 [Candidatus Acidoferrales bacterium]|nr:hypothetical protein [Candidatus Acidoferrales bacterium]